MVIEICKEKLFTLVVGEQLSTNTACVYSHQSTNTGTVYVYNCQSANTGTVCV